MRSRPAIFHGLFYDLERLRDLVILCAGKLHTLETASHHRFHTYGIAGRDAQNGLKSCIVISPVNVLRQQFQFMRGLSKGMTEGCQNRKNCKRDRKSTLHRVPPWALTSLTS